MLRKTQRSPGKFRVALVLTAAMFVSACGGGDNGDDNGNGDGNEEVSQTMEQFPGELADETPQPGGSATFGLEAATGGGWCLPEAQLAIAGIQVARAVYDTLTVPDGEGGSQPFLAESVEPNDDHTVWTITLREGITFHDGSELDAEVVKNNLDAARGEYEGRSSVLIATVMDDIDSVEVVDDLTVDVNLDRTWVAFDSFLFLSGRLGMLAQEQLDSDECARELIGTGPFQLEEWNTSTNEIQLSSFDDYWREDAEGNQLPYLDSLTFEAIPDGQARANALWGGGVDMIHQNTNTEAGMYDEMSSRAEAGEVNFVHSDDFAEVGFLMLNVTEPPFDDPTARAAAAHAIDRELINDTLMDGMTQSANGPFPPGSIGHVDDTGFDGYDPETAQQLVEEYEAEHGQPLEFQISATPQPALIELVDMTSDMFEQVGMSVSTTQVDQTELINTAVSGNYNMMTFRNYPGLDPDNLYVWWHSEGTDGGPNLVNFMGFEDDRVDELLDAGRETADEEERAEIYQDLTRHFAEEHYMLWASWTNWAVPSDEDIYGIVGARPVDAPDGSADYTGFAVGIDPALIWQAGE